MWYFEGESNSTGGYVLINAQTGLPLQEGTRYKVGEQLLNSDHEVSHYHFTPACGERLGVEGHPLFRLQAARSPIARDNRLYNHPCGKAFGANISQVNIESKGGTTPLNYPEQGQVPNMGYSPPSSPEAQPSLCVGKKPR